MVFNSLLSESSPQNSFSIWLGKSALTTPPNLPKDRAACSAPALGCLDQQIRRQTGKGPWSRGGSPLTRLCRNPSPDHGPQHVGKKMVSLSSQLDQTVGKEPCSKEIPRAGEIGVSKELASHAWGPESDPRNSTTAEGESRLHRCPLTFTCVLWYRCLHIHIIHICS